MIYVHILWYIKIWFVSVRNNFHTIFRSLANASLVSRSWNIVCTEPYLWKNYTLVFSSMHSIQNLLNVLCFRRFTNVQKILFKSDDLLSSCELKFGFQSKLESMTDCVSDHYLWVARTLLKTSKSKIKSHKLISYQKKLMYDK